jgi:hypothetical protein
MIACKGENVSSGRRGLEANAGLRGMPLDARRYAAIRKGLLRVARLSWNQRRELLLTYPLSPAVSDERSKGVLC